LRQRDYYNYIIEARPTRYNPGTENPEFYQLLELNDKAEVACTLVLLSTNQY
jgi:hypothetical protein